MRNILDANEESENIMDNPTFLEQLKDWIVGAFHRQILCRLGRHNMLHLFADDDGRDNPAGCFYCGYGFPDHFLAGLYDFLEDETDDDA